MTYNVGMTPAIRVVFPKHLPLERTGRFVRGREVRRVVAPIDVYLELWGGRRYHLTTIEAGFESDGVSRPRYLRWLIEPWGDEHPGALLHDWLLELNLRGHIGKPKFAVDLLFLLALISNGTPFFRSLLMFLGVRTKGFEPA